MSRRRRHNRLRRDVLRQTTRRFFLHSLLGTAGVILFFLLAYWYCAQRVWQLDTPFYWLVHSVHENWPIYFLACILVMVIFISRRHFRKMSGLLEEIIDAVDAVHTEQTDEVVLSDELHEVEVQLNSVIVNARRDRQEAREAEQRKNDLIVYMAHDLKTPLTSVIGYLTLLVDEQNISEALRNKYLDIALRKSERLEDLINEFFEITRFNLSRMTLETSRINLTMMIEQIFYEYQPMFSEKGLTCRLELARDMMVECDADKLERVFDNLLRNAANYSYENTEILVQAAIYDEKYMELVMTNHGRTIPPEKLARIFEQFFRVESARTSRSGGAGLGLAIAREIVTLHGGTLICDSEKETITFTLTLPIS